MNTLLVDIGNTRIKWRSLDPADDDRIATLPLARIDRLSTVWLAGTGESVEGALISNVASANAGATVEAALRSAWPAIRVTFVESSSSRGGVVNGYVQPRQLGADRWMAMIGAHALLPERSLLVCSFGTATTIDLLVKRDEGSVAFVGGMILPGVDAMHRVLVDSTARLPDQPGEAVAFADNTRDAISTGILAAQVGAVQHAWRRALPLGDGSLTCLVAGGSASTIAPLLALDGMTPRVVPDLVLRGLAVLAAEAG